MLSLLQTSARDEAVLAISSFLEYPFWSVRLGSWIFAAAIWVLLIVCFVLFRTIVGNRLEKLAARTATRFDDVAVKLVKDQRTWLYFFMTLFVGSLCLHVSKSLSNGKGTGSGSDEIDQLRNVLQYVAVAAAAIQLFLSSRLIVDFGLEQLLDKTKSPDGKPDPGIRGSLIVLRFVVMLFVAIGVCLLALENFGVKVGPMITGLGIGGIAIALAVQKVLGDVLASVSILMDKPFVIGDTVQVGDKTGTVETIGIKTTRLRAPTGEQLIFGNADILNSRIHNYQRLEQRRVTFSLGVVYELSPEKLRTVPRIIQKIIERKPELQFDRCHLKSFGDWAINFEISYLVNSSDYRLHMDTQQAVLLEIFEEFSKEGIAFAYPTQVTRTMEH